jgi:hypothetical protein
MSTPTPLADLAPIDRMRQQKAWYWYDWANSAFYTTVLSVLFAPYMITVAGKAAGCVDPDETCSKTVSVLGLDLAAGSLPFYLTSFATIASAFVLPVVGGVALPAFILFAVTTALAVGLWLSALNVQYRDVRYTINFVIQFWLFATPVAYPSSLVPAQWRMLYGMKPMVCVVEGFRWCLFAKHEAPSPLIFVSALVVVVLLVGGLFYFRRMEQQFADVV